MKLRINWHTIETQDYVDKRTNRALETTPATDEEVIENVQWLYMSSWLKKPKVIVYRDYDKFIKWVTKNYVKASVRDSVWASVGASVWASVGDSVRDSVGDSVGTSVGASVWDSVGDSVGASVWASVGAWYWSDDLSFADVFADCWILSQDKKEELDKYKKVLSTQRIALYTEDTCYVLVAPVIHRNNEWQLHNQSWLAVDWDGTWFFYLKWVILQKEWYDKIINNELSPEEILAIDNIEHRRIARDYMDKSKLEWLDWYEVLDTVDDDWHWNTMRVIQFNHPDAWLIRYYNCFCPTTGREYYIWTEKTKCKEAKDASFKLENILYLNER